MSVCILEKGSEPGAHILSGAIMDPRALTELFPDWAERGAPLKQKVTRDEFLFLSETGARGTPHALLPECFHNDGNYIVSLGEVTRCWPSRPKRWKCRSSPASPPPKCCTPPTAR